MIQIVQVLDNQLFIYSIFFCLFRSNESLLLKSTCFEVIDLVLTEILNAFCEVNNIFSDDFDQNFLLPLSEFGLKIPSNAEMTVARGYIAKQKKQFG